MSESEIEALRILRASSLFSKLSKSILWRIAGLVQKQNFAIGEYLVRQNEEGDRCFIISKGRVEVFYEADNKRILIGKAGPGEILGELAIIDNLPRSASAIALESTETLVIAQ